MGDKSTGNDKKITIKNDKSRLSQEDVEKMVSDAEKFKDADAKQRQRVETRNNLESYVFQVKQTLDGEKVKEKIDDSERTMLSDKCGEMMRWLDNYTSAEVEDVEEKK